MYDLFELADEFGPHQILHIHEPSQSLRAIVVIDNVALGPAIGGIRLADDVSLQECMRLARAMTLKNAAAGLPHGGGKTVVFAEPKLSVARKQALLRCLGGALRSVPEYIPGPDMGTDEECMAWLHDEGARVVGLPRELGGIPLDELGATGYGVFHATRVAFEEQGVELRGARVVIQGFGSVGQHAARHLVAAGARIVAVSDSRGAVHAPDGLDLDALLQLKKSGRAVREYPRAATLSNEELVGIDCEVWIPAARPDVIREDNAGQLRARFVVQGANIAVTAPAEELLHQRGVCCVPDFIANAGGVICAAAEYRGATRPAAFDAIRDTIVDNTREILQAARRERHAPRQAALALATARLKRAMGLRRWSLFSSSHQ
jgi:glutamate dehydrogenase (NAD(P)+)